MEGPENADVQVNFETSEKEVQSDWSWWMRENGGGIQENTIGPGYV